MLYYLADFFTPYLNLLNVFSYHTVRAAGALVTAFLFIVLCGPRMIRALKELKIGQYIKEDHVADLHALHKSKAGTPTMGGLLMISGAIVALLLWSRLTNPLLLAATGVLCGMGAVGFLDDYRKLRNKQNSGLSARAKLLGQILAGALLGAFMAFYPITYGESYIDGRDVLDWKGLAAALDPEVDLKGRPGLAKLRSQMPPETCARLIEEGPTPDVRDAVLANLNRLLESPGFYDEHAWDGLYLNGEVSSLLAKGPAKLDQRDTVRMNRLLLETAAPALFQGSPRGLATKVAIPGFKDVFISLGLWYVPFVIFVLVAISNGVNLTDGIDGLAAGASVISISAFTAIAYIVSRADWSSYLFITYIPEAAELTVFGAAMLGAGLGFLWFNSHPAEIFMGDTGSLALGGVMGSMAILTKQELLLPIVGGLFVLEALSVVLQVGSFKLRGKRIFRMAPLHHHFELAGWSETKVTMRFWILAFMCALASLATLKLR